MILALFLFVAGACIWKKEDDRRKAEEEAAYQLWLNETEVRYLAADTEMLFVSDTEGEEAELCRGSAVDLYIHKEVESEEELCEIGYQDKRYYIPPSSLVFSREECVREEVFFTARDEVLYKEAEGTAILGSLKAGEEVRVTGYHILDDCGHIDKYQVQTSSGEGWLKNDAAHLMREYTDTSYDSSIYSDYQNSGGCARDILYYPKTLYDIEGNEMPEVVKALYINAATISSVDEYIAIAEQCAVNAFVIDIKDTHIISYDSDIVKSYSPSSNPGVNSAEKFGEYVNRLKEKGYYLIGRITVFKDSAFAEDNPETAIMRNENFYRYNSAYWPSIFSRKVWEYNVSLGLEAAQMFGFNEIQFDYVRSPETVPADCEMHNAYNESRVQAITNFIRYAVDVLHEAGVYVSIDVFGETAQGYVTSYGQLWQAISNAADVISAMPYPDHFSRGTYGLKEPWKEPYALMVNWGLSAADSQKETYDPAKVRTWIQAYDSVVDGTVYDAEKITAQIDALRDAGVLDGYITWNGAASYRKFATYVDALK